MERGNKFRLSGKFRHKIGEFALFRNLLSNYRNRLHLIARTILILQIELVVLNAIAYNPREGCIDIVLQQHLEIQR